MNPAEEAMIAATRAYQIQDMEKTLVAGSGAGGSGLGSAGPPTWDRQAWEAFRAQYGFYPFGMQQGAFVAPATYQGAPDWVYELMGIRKPPIGAGNYE